MDQRSANKPDLDALRFAEDVSSFTSLPLSLQGRTSRGALLTSAIWRHPSFVFSVGGQPFRAIRAVELTNFGRCGRIGPTSVHKPGLLSLSVQIQRENQLDPLLLVVLRLSSFFQARPPPSSHSLRSKVRSLFSLNSVYNHLQSMWLTFELTSYTHMAPPQVWWTMAYIFFLCCTVLAAPDLHADSHCLQPAV